MEELRMGATIARRRKENGLTQEALANRLGVTNQAVSKWEGDVCCPDIQLLPALADALGLSLDALFGREAPEPPKEERPAEEVKVETAPIGIVEKLPWADDDSLHAVLYQGHRLLQSERVPERSGSTGHVSPRQLDARLPDEWTDPFTGTVRDIYSDFAVHCEGDVSGSVQAGDGVQCGGVGGSVNAGDGVTCGDVEGSVHAGDGVQCERVGGNISAGDGVTCGDVGGSVRAGESVRCGSVGGDVRANDSVHIQGGVSGEIQQG